MNPSNPSTSTGAAPDPSLVLFARGVIARLHLWPALRLAVQESWGGPDAAEKRTWMASVIVDAFDPTESPKPPDVYYIEEMLLQIMADEFTTNLEDESAEGVAKDIMKLWALLGTGEADVLVKGWEETVQKVKGKKVIHQEEAGEDSDWDDESDENATEEGMEVDEEVPNLLPPREERKREEPVVDEEGFTLVKAKGKSR